jgi:UDP-galactose transporter B1
MEALANVIVGYFGLFLTSRMKRRHNLNTTIVTTDHSNSVHDFKHLLPNTNNNTNDKNNNHESTTSSPEYHPKLPKLLFLLSGTSQVCSKAFTSLSLAYGLSFPVATLSKSAKMAPVMIGQLILGGDRYSIREYLQVSSIVCGTAMLNFGKSKQQQHHDPQSQHDHSSYLGITFILLSLAMDGITGGLQKKLKRDMKLVGVQLQPYDFMFWTNLYMMIVALIISFTLGDFQSGIQYCISYPQITPLLWKFSLCSAIGQSFIFYTVAHFDPLVCSTVTTTRKMFSVLLSILWKGHVLTLQAWTGVMLACLGILSEVWNQFRNNRGHGHGRMDVVGKKDKKMIVA